MISSKKIIITFLFFIMFNTYSESNPICINGVLDLSNYDLKSNTFKLHGDWLVYKGQHVDPLNNNIFSNETIKVPSLFKPTNKKTSLGIASLKLKIILPKSQNRILQIRLKRVVASYKLFINGKELIKNGVPGTSFETTTPDYSPASATFQFDGDELDLIIQISNFHSPTGSGIFQEITIGTPDLFNKKSLIPILFEILISGFLFTTGIYHIILYLTRRSDKSPFYLGMFCMIMGIRPLFLNTINFYLFFNLVPWSILHKIELYSIIGSSPFIAYFFRELFPEHIKKSYVNIYCLLSYLLTFFLIILPPPLFYHTLTIFYLPSIAVSFYTITKMFNAVLKKSTSSLNFFIGFIILFFSIVNDILFSLGIINTGFTLSYGVFIFIFAQTTIIASRHNKSFKVSETLSKELLISNYKHKEINKELEGIIKERKKDLENEIAEKEMIKEELNKTHKLEAIGILAGGIAHDFNNLLTIMLGNIFLAKQNSESELIQTPLDDAEKAGKRATELANQLLTFSRGGTPIKKISSIKDIIISTTELSLRGSNITYKFDIANNLKNCEVDEGQICQVISNIIINAKQAMPDGGNIIIKAQNIKYSNINDNLIKDDFVQISISDDGNGIPKNIINRIFDPFFTTKSSGKGFGLSICYSIIQKHGGTITVESTENKGTTFNIFIKSTNLHSKENPVSITKEINGDAKKILVIDDEDFILKIVKQMLTLLGFNCTTSLNSDEGIDLFNNAIKENQAFSIVIVDLTIPGYIGGIEVVSKLKEIDPDIIAIAASGYSNSPVMSSPEKYGFSAVLKKPFELNDLKNLFYDIFYQ